MTPRAIMTAAHKAGIVSYKLYGKTQHKTLGARLSEDLLRNGERSLFFRTEPGRYFLREFLTDTTIPESFRRPVPTRRRFRELVLGPVLALDDSALAPFGMDTAIDPYLILRLLNSNSCRYEDPRRRSPHSVFFRAFVCVRRGSQILSYRLGRYREDRDSFIHKRCIGFATFVHDFENTLFSQSDFGILDSGIRATKIDLDIPDVIEDIELDKRRSNISKFIWTSENDGKDLLAVIGYECPSWFEPTKRRLALNDICWIDDPSSINNIDDFDPWSRQVLKSVFKSYF